MRENAGYVLLRKAASLPIKAPSELLKKAIPADLEKVVLAHAQITFEERGYDPLESEPEKFRERCLERINNEQTWICTQDDEVIFKAELMCQTADVAYLEAIWTNPELRNRGYGTRLLNELNYRVLQKSKYVYLLTEAGNLRKIKFYRKTGFEKVGEYTASYLKDNCQASIVSTKMI